jgi:hypothetical protein
VLTGFVAIRLSTWVLKHFCEDVGGKSTHSLSPQRRHPRFTKGYNDRNLN